jgi:hypothetical protein
LSKGWNRERDKKRKNSDDYQPTFGRADTPAALYRYRYHGGDYRPRVKNLSNKSKGQPAEN